MTTHIMFDIDGTLVQSFEFDELLFVEAVKAVTGLKINDDWENYPNVTDAGLIRTFCEQTGKQNEFEQLHDQIKTCFVKKIDRHLKQNQVKQTAGASEFLSMLRRDPKYHISIATGGWGETARLKLNSAGIDIDGIPLRSSNDDYRRTHIMQQAAVVANTIYFGDGSWDKKACQILGYDFIAVGPRIGHLKHVKDFTNPDKILGMIESITTR